MRQTIKEIEVNIAYRWFLGLDTKDKVPHFTTLGKNYTIRFKDIDLFEKIFSKILQECYRYKLIDTKIRYIDSTPVKACTNSRKYEKKLAKEESMFFEEAFKKEINDQRESKRKKY